MMDIGVGGNRKSWEFEYTAKALADGARTQMAFRLARVERWTEAKAKVMADVKEGGIEVSESAGADFGNAYKTQLAGPQVLVRADLQAKLTECHQKIGEHQQKAGEYDGWIQLLDANPEARVKLTQSDWLYFFGRV